jgi:hypothetical protein
VRRRYGRVPRLIGIVKRDARIAVRISAPDHEWHSCVRPRHPCAAAQWKRQNWLIGARRDADPGSRTAASIRRSGMSRQAPASYALRHGVRPRLLSRGPFIDESCGVPSGCRPRKGAGSNNPR